MKDCLAWLIWWEHNNHTFEDIVRSVDLLKPILVGTLFQSGRIWGFTHCISISEFLLSVHISSWGTCIRFKFRVFTIVNMMSFLWNKSLITYQKKPCRYTASAVYWYTNFGIHSPRYFFAFNRFAWQLTPYFISYIEKHLN